MLLECRMDLQNNMDFPGSDVSQIYASDAKHCQQLCTDHPSCLFFTFVRPDWTRDTRYKRRKRLWIKWWNFCAWSCGIFYRHFYCYLKFTTSGEPKTKTPLLGVTSGYSLKPCTQELRGKKKNCKFYWPTVSNHPLFSVTLAMFFQNLICLWFIRMWTFLEQTTDSCSLQITRTVSQSAQRILPVSSLLL